MVAAKIKMNANGAHTFLEVSKSGETILLQLNEYDKIVKVRFGTSAHLLFTFYGVLCNLIVCGSLVCALLLFPTSFEMSVIHSCTSLFK